MGLFSSLVFEASPSEALRRPSPVEYAPCALISNARTASRILIYGLMPGLYDIQDATNEYFSWRMADGFANPPVWANLTSGDSYTLAEGVLGDSKRTLDHAGIVTFCNIRIDRVQINRAADLEGISRAFLYQGVVKHELGHCMGLWHFEQANNILSEFNRTVMNSLLWKAIDHSQGGSAYWLRYNDDEIDQLRDDLIGPFNGLMTRCEDP